MAKRAVFEYRDSVLGDWVEFAAERLIAHGATFKLYMTQGNWQDGASCEIRAAVNTKFVSSTQFDNGGGTETLNDTNLTANECPIRVRIVDDGGATFTLASVLFWAYDGATITTRAAGLEIYAFEQGEGGTAWTLINDDSASVGGSGSGLSLAGNSGASEYIYYLAVSARVESGQPDNDYPFALGFKATIS